MEKIIRLLTVLLLLVLALGLVACGGSGDDACKSCVDDDGDGIPIIHLSACQYFCINFPPKYMIAPPFFSSPSKIRLSKV